MAPYAEGIAQADYSNHPWAQLLVAAALNDWRDDGCFEYLAAAEAKFAGQADRLGLGHAAMVAGSIALGRGHLAEAAQAFQSCREYLGADCRVDAGALAHSGLGAYVNGDLDHAIAITEEALAIARLQLNRRFEGVASLYLGFYTIIRGDFARAESLFDRAEDAYRELPDRKDRFELPLIIAGQGVIAAMRGQASEAERLFSEATATAEAADVGWYAAIALAIRAEFIAAQNPRRATADARNAHEQLAALGDEWWGAWAIRAQATAAREAGDIATSVAILERLLATDLNPIERGLTLLALGESHVRGDNPAGAVPILREAQTTVAGVGARYWTAQAWLTLAQAQPAQADAHRRRAVALADDDLAFRRLLGEAEELRITVLGDCGIWRGTRRLRFPTRNAELAIYSLVLAEPAGLHEDVLIERLWPEVPKDRGAARLRTVLWQMRMTLGRDRWRVRRQREAVRLVTDGVAIDVADVRHQAEAILADGIGDSEERQTIAARLVAPMLPAYEFEPWVADEVAINSALAERLLGTRTA